MSQTLIEFLIRAVLAVFGLLYIFCSPFLARLTLKWQCKFSLNANRGAMLDPSLPEFDPEYYRLRYHINIALTILIGAGWLAFAIFAK